MHTQTADFLKIYTIHHIPVEMPETDILFPIDAGISTGDNIAKNNNWSELRVHYWVYKNEPLADYVGFFHFRRYLYPKIIKSKRPYIFKNKPEKSDYTSEVWNSIVKDQDIIAPRAEYTGLSVYERYACYENQNIDDLLSVVEILKSQHPDYADATERYLQGKEEYYGNIFVMKKELFREYCSWLFPILDQFREKNINAKPRTEGYLAERLFGIWLTYQKQKNKKVSFLPRVHFSCYDDNNHKRSFKRILFDFFFTPGSKRRGFVNAKHLKKHKNT